MQGPSYRIEILEPGANEVSLLGSYATREEAESDLMVEWARCLDQSVDPDCPFIVTPRTKQGFELMRSRDGDVLAVYRICGPSD